MATFDIVGSAMAVSSDGLTVSSPMLIGERASSQIMIGGGSKNVVEFDITPDNTVTQYIYIGVIASAIDPDDINGDGVWDAGGTADDACLKLAAGGTAWFVNDGVSSPISTPPPMFDFPFTITMYVDGDGATAQIWWYLDGVALGSGDASAGTTPDLTIGTSGALYFYTCIDSV